MSMEAWIMCGCFAACIPMIFGLRRMVQRQSAQWAALDAMREKNGYGELLRLTKTYRAPLLLLFAGLIFLLAGGFAQFDLTRKALTPEPLHVQVELLGQRSSHNASPLEKGLWLFFPVPFWGVGFYLIALWKNYRLEVSEDSMHATDFRGRRYRWRWDEITRAKRVYNQGHVYYVVGDSQRTVKIDAGDTHSDLDAMLKSRFQRLLY